MLRPYLLAIVIVPLTFAQLTDAVPPDTSCLHRTLPLSIQDARGLPLRDATASDVEARIHGAGIKVLSLAPDDRQHRIVILLDASGSMQVNWFDAVVLASALADFRLPNVQMALLI